MTIDEFSPYVSCIASVSFHVTKGHVVDSIHPKQHTELLPPAFLAAIARLSLPDMTIDREGDVKFTFRFRFAEEFYFGCVFFRQQRDEQEKRGYMQKSVVVLTRSHEFVSLCQDLAQVIGPVFFSYSCNCEVLEQCCMDVMGWAQPSNGEPVLTVAGTRLQSMGQYPAPHKMFTDVPLFTTFGSLTVSLWPLWELVLTGQSILVLGPTPDRCSKAVLGICSLISPVPMRYDFRPFLTVLDHDFTRLCDAKQQQSGHPCVVGGSNPFLLKCFEHFPNMVSLGSAPSTASSATPSALQSNGNLLPPEFGLFRRTPTLRSLLKNNKWDVPLLITKDRQLVVGREDKLLQRLKQGTNAQNNELLRQYFYALTKRFLEPLESFLRIRASGEVRAYQDDTSARAFGLESFLYFLSKQPVTARAPATTKPFPVKLYEGFVQGPNFAAWLELEQATLARERFTIMRTLIVETSSRELLGIRGMEDRVVHYIELEQAKGSKKDRELCSKMYEHLNAIQQDQPCL